jgi:hypothetical protein
MNPGPQKYGVQMIGAKYEPLRKERIEVFSRNR